MLLIDSEFWVWSRENFFSHPTKAAGKYALYATSTHGQMFGVIADAVEPYDDWHLVDFEQLVQVARDTHYPFPTRLRAVSRADLPKELNMSAARVEALLADLPTTKRTTKPASWRRKS